MEKFDVVIVGGGSAGLAALKRLSSAGKQAILIEAGSTVGTKNVSGGIIYSKNPRSGKVFNVEDIFENFLEEKPWERKIVKYVLNCVSKDKTLSIDITNSHDHQSNFGYTVLLNKLNSWFAKEALEHAERNGGGGIVTGVHVKNIKWDEQTNNTIIETDELDDFACKVVIASDGVNSELAEMTGAREKFSPSELYQGVKAIARLPEEIINERFNIKDSEGVAHIFAGDITLGHIGGSFLYTNKDTLSLGTVCHYDSLLSKPIEPYHLLDTLLQNPFVKEFIKDEVAVEPITDKSLSQMEQIRTKFSIDKLIKKWTDLRFNYNSASGKRKYLEKEFKSEEEIKAKLDSIYKELIDKYHASFKTDYVELEYSTRLIPDGKRCRMKKPYFKNVLFIGDAAGRGLFIGPRIEGLNVGIDDAARACDAILKTFDKNNFEVSSSHSSPSYDYLGNLYSEYLQNSPYTMDMQRLDKYYVKTIIDSMKKHQIISNLTGKYKILFKMMLNDSLRNFFIDVVNKIGYDNLLSIIESEQAYIKTPVEMAEKFGVKSSSEYSITLPNIMQRVSKLRYNDDSKSHIQIKNSKSDFMKKMVRLCPTKCYSLEGEDNVILQHEGCIECGTCAKETNWTHPRGEKGIEYRFG